MRIMLRYYQLPLMYTTRLVSDRRIDTLKVTSDPRYQLILSVKSVMWCLCLWSRLVWSSYWLI